MGDLNTDLGEVDGDRRGAEISAALTEAGLEDMATHFMPRQRRGGRPTRAGTDKERRGARRASWGRGGKE